MSSRVALCTEGSSLTAPICPPRALGRVPALKAWEQALRERGGQPFPASSSLLGGVRLPNTEQRLILHRNGITDEFWNMLTVVGKIEARGAFIGLFPVPDLSMYIVEDTTTMGIGHLAGGLFEAHGNSMRAAFRLRESADTTRCGLPPADLAFGPDAHPDVEPQPGLAREDGGSLPARSRTGDRGPLFRSSRTF